ncbi:MAG: cobalamin-binding protein [Flavobacteriales bacterium]|nr:MAG: cobalamin-binding protein [Flavobacteriales bacterium]
MIFTDQIGHKFELNSVPKRIISIVPSQTELLYDLGLDEKVVGITKFCIHPKEWYGNKNRVGGTKNINFSKIAELKPDLIIANKEENTKEQVEELQKIYPVYTSDISNLEESLAMINDIGILTNTKEKSISITEKIQYEFNKLTEQNFETKRVLYLIWKNPYMSINQNRFINDMMQRCGFQNVISSSVDYPEISEDQISSLNPDLILLSSEPYPFKENHIKALQILSPKSKVILVDGEYFSWYGSRLLGSPNYFISLLNEIT